ncbi:MAG: DUF2207 domain-containing protein [Romboutsia sp.]|nr:DUF2207 domain-containing protein [Romboutsia sp.]
MFKLIYSIFVILISLIFVFIVLILKRKSSERKMPVSDVKADPPEGLNPQVLTYLYMDRVKNEYMNSIMLNLVKKGYLKIEETSLRDSQTNSKNYRITKLKEYNDGDKNEELYLKELIQYGFNKVSVSSSDLYGNLGTTTSEIKKNISNEYKDKIFEPLMSSIFKFIVIMISIIVLLIFVIPLIIPFKIMNIISGIIVIASIGAIAYFGKDIKERTGYGNKILEEIECFKKFIEKAEKEQLDNLLVENPNCFYDILPYAFALGISDKWIEKFNDISFQKPDWFESQNEFKLQNIKEFVDFLKNLK